MNSVDDSVFRPTWAFAHRVTSNGIVININKSDHRRSRYSIDIQFQSSRNSDESYKHHGVKWETRENVVRIRRIADDIATATDQAEDWIEAEMQKAEIANMKSGGK
jgi:hypothetical protein